MSFQWMIIFDMVHEFHMPLWCYHLKFLRFQRNFVVTSCNTQTNMMQCSYQFLSLNRVYGTARKCGSSSPPSSSQPHFLYPIELCTVHVNFKDWTVFWRNWYCRDLYFVQGSCDHMSLCFQPLPLPILPPPTSSGHPCYTAIYDYKAASGDQVSFMEGKTMHSCSPIYSSVWGCKAGEPKSLLCHKADFYCQKIVFTEAVWC